MLGKKQDLTPCLAQSHSHSRAGGDGGQVWSVSRWIGGRLNLDFRYFEIKQNGRLDPAFGEGLKLELGVYI
jgi:hypothetical protein